MFSILVAHFLCNVIIKTSLFELSTRHGLPAGRQGRPEKEVC